MSKQIDAYSFALGVCETFCEVVRAGVKRIALSHPFTEDELQNALGADFLPACEAVARKYGCKAYYLKEPLVTDLFPISLNRGKQNIIFYREDRDLEEFLSIQHDKQTLIAENNYTAKTAAKSPCVTGICSRTATKPSPAIYRKIQNSSNQRSTPMSMIINKELPNPAALKAEFPVPEHIKEIKAARDKEIAAVFRGESDKFLVIVGPCSADNEESVCEYTRRLARVNEQVKDRLILIPRIYTNKPRTTGEGYKGMLHQPDPDKAPDLLGGIIAIRKMHMRAIEETGLTCADEMLYPENRSYLDDLLSYEAIGARSVENQQHRLTASSMDIPAGMKNPTSGDLAVMMNSIKAAQSAHNFIYRGCDVTTTGNPLAHAILRGGVDKYGTTIPNYHYEDLKRLASLYEESGLENPACVVDVNHSNSGKKFKEQIRIVSEVLHSRSYDPAIHKLVKGVMIESYLFEGAQKICPEMIHGKSITDPCLGWEDTEKLLYSIAEKA